ncbi:MAG: DUF4019 domain-containing protein [Deltaproteobacteria bacterium]|nr:DUF4019 domain-containing protein [Deltaproteobacteria bacterium]
MRYGLAFAVLLFLAATPASAGPPASPGATGDAVAAAQAWLALLDAGRIDDSWREAASPFRQQVSQSQWKTAVSAARSPYGAFISRRLRGAKYTDSLPGAPDGHYVVIQFEARYARKHSAIETVTPMLEGGGWRVSGYFIR